MAEYQALIAGVEMALDRGVRRLAIFSDSELIVRQIEGRYKVKNDGLRPFHQDAKSLLSRLEEYEIRSIPRESNARPTVSSIRRSIGPSNKPDFQQSHA